MSTKSASEQHVESVVVPVASAAAPAIAPSAPTTNLVTVALPPAATLPVPPAYTPATPGEFRAVVPRSAELSALPQALVDLTSFAAFDQTMGSTAPTQAEVMQALTAGAEWSATCQATRFWAGYALLMEGLAWRLIRAQLESVRPAFALAVKRNPKLAEQYGGLAKLLTVPATTSRAGAATKRANKKAIADGKEPIHGKVGKKRQRAAEKAALAAAQGAAAPAVVGSNGVSHETSRAT